MRDRDVFTSMVKLGMRKTILTRSLFFFLIQSPINLDACLSADDVKLPPIRFSRGYSELVAGRLENNGHTGKRERERDSRERQ